MPNNRKQVIIKHTKSTILRLTFYMHHNVYIHLIVLFLMNVLISMAIFGIFNVLDPQILTIDIRIVVILALNITWAEHMFKVLIPLKLYATLSKTFGLSTVIIVFLTTALTVLMLSNPFIQTVEPLVIYALILVFIRFYMRGVWLRFMRHRKRR